MPELSEKQLAEIRQMNVPGLARAKERKIRDLARDLHEGRVPAADPDGEHIPGKRDAEAMFGDRRQDPAPDREADHDLPRGRGDGGGLVPAVAGRAG